MKRSKQSRNSLVEKCLSCNNCSSLFCSRTGHDENESLESGLMQHLLPSSEQKQNEDGDDECNDSEDASEDSHRPATSVASAYRLLTPSVKVRNFLVASVAKDF